MPDHPSCHEENIVRAGCKIHRLRAPEHVSRRALLNGTLHPGCCPGIKVRVGLIEDEYLGIIGTSGGQSSKGFFAP